MPIRFPLNSIMGTLPVVWCIMVMRKLISFDTGFDLYLIYVVMF